MAATGAIPAKGSLLKYYDLNLELYATFAEVTNITGLEIIRTMARATHLNSDNGAEEYVGCEHGVTVSFDVNFLPLDSTQGAGASGLLDMFSGDYAVIRDFRLILSDSGNEQYDFSGWAATFAIDAQGGDVIKGTVTLRGSGTATVS